MKIFIMIIFLLSLSGAIIAQTDTTTALVDIDNILEDATTDNEDAEYYDLVEYFLNNKLVLNRSSINDLMKVPYVDHQTAEAIIRHRNLLGGIYSSDQLKNIEDVSPDLIEKILPFLQLGDARELSFFDSIGNQLKGTDISVRSRGITDLKEERAFREGKYEGSAWKIYNRLIISKNKNIRLGILTEKDPGERPLNDFTTFHLYAREIGVIKNIVAGDYLFEFGHGLALWSRYSIGKGTETVGILPRNGKGIIPYLSSDENMFLRGGAIQLEFNKLKISTFYSGRHLDGSIDPVTNQITSIRIDGFHRSSNEIAHKRIIGEKLFGISAEYNFGDSGSFGFLYYTSQFGNDFRKESILDPSGNRFDYLSASYNIFSGKLTFSGETSFNLKSFATINNIQFIVNKYFTLLFSYRSYPEDYWGLHANGFGERDGTQNEKGFYTGLKLRTNLGTIFFYYDQFKFPFTGEKLPFSSEGNEFLIYYTVKPFPNTEFRLRYTNQKKDDVEIIRDEFGLRKIRSESIRGDLILKISKSVQLRSRINFVGVTPSSDANSEKGFLIFQDLKYSPIPAVGISTRLILFKTDSYDSRVYEFESDLTGVMTNPPLYGEGLRWYILIQYRTQFGVTISAKYSELFKPGVKTISSGDTEIRGNIDNRLSFQMDFQF